MSTHRPWYTVLYIQVLIAIAIGIFIGHFWPDLGKALKPLGDGFIALIKMMIERSAASASKRCFTSRRFRHSHSLLG